LYSAAPATLKLHSFNHLVIYPRMGSIHSYMSSELTVAAVIVTGLLGYGYVQYNAKPAEQQQKQPAAVTLSKKGKKKSQPAVGSGDDTTKTPVVVVPFPNVVPGGFATDTASQVDTDAPGAPKAAKKAKKKKAASKKAGASVPDNQSEGGSSAAAESIRPPTSKRRQSVLGDQEEAWTRVESRRRQKNTTQVREGVSNPELTSDAGVTTSVTGNSSPVSEDEEATPPPEDRRTLAEKMLSKGRKTGVEEFVSASCFVVSKLISLVQHVRDIRLSGGGSSNARTTSPR
jgi:hypothetical protein